MKVFVLSLGFLGFSITTVAGEICSYEKTRNVVQANARGMNLYSMIRENAATSAGDSIQLVTARVGVNSAQSQLVVYQIDKSSCKIIGSSQVRTLISNERNLESTTKKLTDQSDRLSAIKQQIELINVIKIYADRANVIAGPVFTLKTIAELLSSQEPQQDTDIAKRLINEAWVNILMLHKANPNDWSDGLRNISGKGIKNGAFLYVSISHVDQTLLTIRAIIESKLESAGIELLDIMKADFQLQKDIVLTVLARNNLSWAGNIAIMAEAIEKIQFFYNSFVSDLLVLK